MLVKLADGPSGPMFQDGKQCPLRNMRARLQVRGGTTTGIDSQIVYHSSTPSLKRSLQYTPGTLAGIWHGHMLVGTLLFTCGLYLIFTGPAQCCACNDHPGN